MADRNPISVPHNQQIIDAISSAEQFLMFDENNNEDVPLLDNFVNEMVHETGVPGDYGTTQFSGFGFQEINNENMKNYNGFPYNSSFGNPTQIPVWPIPPSPHTCTCCQTLREFFHINGSRVLKLDIHGRLGIISHAVLERYNNTSDISSHDHKYYIFDFCNESISNVKQFLIQYCEDRRREGFIMLQDPLSNFYDALCIGIDGDGDGGDVFLQPTSTGDVNTNHETNLNEHDRVGNGAVNHTKSHVAAQRERTGKMKLRDLARYFHLPISVASKEMNICPSAIKGICRKEGLLRWPYRKIKSIESKILKEKQSLNSNDADERQRALTEIQELERELANFYEAYVG